MTDNEKALDILQKFDLFYGQRAGRELWNEKPTDVQNEDIDNFKRDVAFLEDFVNRQKAEIERLEAETDRLNYILQCYALEYGTAVDKERFLKPARAEAVKEFAERLKEKAKANEWNGTICGLDIDNLVKEFTEGGE